MIDLGLRAATLDIDYDAEADDPAALVDLEHAIRALKVELDVNVEPASPADFLPVSPGAHPQSRYVGRFGSVSVYYYHLPSHVIGKAARAYEQDLDDAEQLIRAGEVTWSEIDQARIEMRRHPTAGFATSLTTSSDASTYCACDSRMEEHERRL